MNAVVKKIETILRSSYDTKNYVDLIREIFPKVSIVSPDKFRKEFTNFSSHIEGSVHVGNYKTPDKKNIIIMAVQLKNVGYVENSRSTQRSYAKKLIENANADAAFIAFYTEGEPKWRLSFVRLDYEMKIAMPDDKATVETLENLVDEVRELLKSFQEHDDKVQNVLEQIDKIIYRFYGLTDNEILCVENGQR